MTAGLRLEGVRGERDGFLLGPVDLEVAPGEIVWLAGPNGTGKSTLLAIIAGLLPLAAGRIVFAGSVLADARTAVEPWRRPIGVLLQDLGLWPHLDIEKQCRLVAPSLAASRITELARALGVEALLGRRPDALSGGEAQRCALLRTLLPEASLLLLDEPFSEQHDDGIARIEAVLAERSSCGTAIIVAGHRDVEGARRIQLTAPEKS